MQPRKNNRMMQRGGKHRHGGRNQNRGPQQGGQNRGRININQVTNQRDKYQNQARDAMHGGDRVLSEYYLQHADHYQRLINEFNEEQEARRAQSTEHQSEAEGDNGDDQGDDDASDRSSVPLPPAIPRDRDDMEPKSVD